MRSSRKGPASRTMSEADDSAPLWAVGQLIPAVSLLTDHRPVCAPHPGCESVLASPGCPCLQEACSLCDDSCTHPLVLRLTLTMSVQ